MYQENSCWRIIYQSESHADDMRIKGNFTCDATIPLQKLVEGLLHQMHANSNCAAGSVSNIRGSHRAKMFVPASSPLRLVTPAGSTEVDGKGIPFARHS